MPKYGNEKVVEFDGIGPVYFINSVTGKNIRISIRPVKGVQVFVPQFISFKAATEFVQLKKTWIKKQLTKIACFERGLTSFDKSTSFKTREHVLKLCTHDKPSIRIIVNKELIQVSYPDFVDIKDQRIQTAIRRAIIETWRLEAKKILPPLVKRLACKHGFRYNKVSIRNNTTRWGSCSKDNNISLNLHLMRLPQHLCEYVILHELAHTVYKNHQQTFWGLLNKLTGNARKLDRELNEYKIGYW